MYAPRADEEPMPVIAGDREHGAVSPPGQDALFLLYETQRVHFEMIGLIEYSLQFFPEIFFFFFFFF